MTAHNVCNFFFLVSVSITIQTFCDLHMTHSIRMRACMRENMFVSISTTRNGHNQNMRTIMCIRQRWSEWLCVCCALARTQFNTQHNVPFSVALALFPRAHKFNEIGKIRQIDVNSIDLISCYIHWFYSMNARILIATNHHSEYNLRSIFTWLYASLSLYLY